MSDTKQYYYLKLKENFYDRPEIKVIKRMPNGYQYISILMMMYLRSLENEGKLIFMENIPYDIIMLAEVLNEDPAHIQKAIEIFEKFKLVDLMSDGTIYMSQIQQFIGKSNSEADRKRIYRQRISEHKQLGHSSTKRAPKTELKTETKKELKQETNIPEAGEIAFSEETAEQPSSKNTFNNKQNKPIKTKKVLKESNEPAAPVLNEYFKAAMLSKNPLLVYNYGHGGKLFKDLLNIATVEKIKEVIDAFFNTENYWAKLGYKLGNFQRAWNDLVTVNNKKQKTYKQSDLTNQYESEKICGEKRDYQTWETEYLKKQNAVKI